MAELKRKHVILRGKGQPHAGFADVFYIEELRLQCEFGLRSLGEIQQRVAAGPTDLVLFAFIQMMLGFAGNASKLLGPPKQSGAKGRARAARLRKVLGLASTSILDDRAARNYVEHFDERIDAYVGKLDGVLLHRLVGSTPSDKIRVDGKRLSAHYLLHFNPATFELSFLGDSVRLVDLAEELKRISDIAAAYLATLSDNSSSAPPAA